MPASMDNRNLLLPNRTKTRTSAGTSADLDGCVEASCPKMARLKTVLSGTIAQLRHVPLAAAACGVLALGVAAGGLLHATPANAQVSGDALFGEGNIDPAAQMLLEADELIYDDANNTVSAVGNVQIAYDNYTLVAERITYDRNSGRVVAFGNVEIVEPNGNRVFAEEIDITDDFQDGFVSALRVETPQNTRFAAESAERRDGELAVFNNGVYTACEVCKENPSKPPLWQIRANRVIVNTRTRTVSYEGASFELFGRPIAYLPRFSHADPSIRRKSGFLLVRPTFSEELGVGAGTSYFWALAPNYDLTVSGKYYTRQGFLAQAEWRHRTANGEYNLRFAGIDQKDPEAFDSDQIDRNVTERGAIMSSGRFQINPRWSWGWNILAQSDGNFARTYDLEGYRERDITNEIYLTGLNKKNFFDLRAQKFLIQDDRQDQLRLGNPDLFPDKDDKRQDQQALVLPVFDYSIVSDRPVAGGQVSLDVNVTSISRDRVDILNYSNPDGDVRTASLLPNERHHGIAGKYTRASVETEWKASSILNGALITTSLSARGDAMMLNTDDLDTEYNPLTSNDDLYRGMPAAMLEIRYPLVASNSMVSQIFEPIAQVIVRPNETHIGKFPNEDAQSMVFDTTNLFERDKFSGFDRVEGGTRANVGFRYSASFANGASLNLAAGQSFHLHGQNSYAERDLVNAGMESGLETDKSDYVASVDLDSGMGLGAGVFGRFDEKTGEVRRGEVSARYVDPNVALTGSYIFIDEQPKYGFAEDRHEVRGSGSLRITENVRVFASASFDIENDNLFSRSAGIAYDDQSCFSLAVAYQENDDRYTGEAVDRRISFSLSLRTIGHTQFERTLYDNTE